ncbi:MAG: hypothetical protein U5R48_15520 [Gammaproteobacteria bacterium]|nr:hypothetical protein [Gammaproteobacteria bacterium]
MNRPGRVDGPLGGEGGLGSDLTAVDAAVASFRRATEPEIAVDPLQVQEIEQDRDIAAQHGVPDPGSMDEASVVGQDDDTWSQPAF